MDDALLLALNALRGPLVDGVLSALSEWGMYAFPAFLLARFLARRTADVARAMRDGWLAFFLSTFVSETIVKPLVRRPRPTAVPELLAHLHVLGTKPPATSFGFPSGTAAACGAGAAWIWLVAGPRLGVPAIVLALVVSAARVAAGVHYPSDVLAGLLLGALTALGVQRLSRYAGR